MIRLQTFLSSSTISGPYGLGHRAPSFIHSLLSHDFGNAALLDVFFSAQHPPESSSMGSNGRRDMMV